MRPLLALRDVSATALAGAAAGALALGVGGRLAMRVSGALSPAHLQGVRTSTDAVVGAITWSGTMQVVVLGALLGATGAGFYLAAKPLLPARRRAWALALLTLLVMGATAVDAGNTDFRRFGPRAVNVVAFGALPLLYGALLVRLEPAIRARLPAGPWIAPLHAGISGLALVLACMGPFLVAETHPRTAAAMLALVVVGWAARLPRVGRYARPAVVVPCAIGGLGLGAAVAALL